MIDLKEILIMTFSFILILGCQSEVEIFIKETSNSRPLADLNIEGITKTDFAIGGSFSWDYTDIGGGADISLGLASDVKGNLYIAGYITNGDSSKDAAIWKLDKEGNLVTSFGNNSGVFIYDYAGRDDEFKDIKIDLNGDVIVAGYSENGSGYADMIVFKLSSNGVLRNNFASSGIYRYTDPDVGLSEGERANCLIVSNSGKIFAAGQGAYFDDKSPKIWALTNSGSLDTSFGNANGIFEHDDIAGGSAADKIFGCLLDSEGRILISGQSWAGSGSGRHEAFVGRILSTGSIDLSFGINGFYVTGNIGGGNNADLIGSLATDSNGNIYAGGKSHSTFGHYMAFVQKLNSSGVLDTSFSDLGTLELVHSTDIYNISELKFSDNKLYFSGTRSGASTYGFIGKVDSLGEFDLSFGDDGLYIPDYLNGDQNQGFSSFGISNEGILSACGSVFNGVDKDIFVHQVE